MSEVSILENEMYGKAVFQEETYAGGDVQETVLGKEMCENEMLGRRYLAPRCESKVCCEGRYSGE